MIKLLIAGRRASGKSRDAALKHLRTVHGPLVYDAPPDSGQMPIRYVQNHVFDGPAAAELAPYQSDRDLVTEVWFDDFGQLAQATSTPYYRNVLNPDEDNFVDKASVKMAVVQETRVSVADHPDAVKLFVFLKRKPDMSFDAFAQRCAVAAQEPSPLGLTINIPLPPPGGGEPFSDCILEWWFRDRDAAAEFCLRRLPALFEALNDILLSPQSFYVLADEFTVARLRATAGI